MADHPFDRYAEFTDLTALKEFSEKPLRKCMRVNTLKMKVEDFTEYAAQKNWKLEPVPWCSEGFFIDRDDRSIPLGKDILHILGHTYMQEASSMLPVALLDPKPGEAVLDMAAAPGSKSTQIAALMQGKGALIANDMQDARIKTLLTALNRLGVHNVRVTKKMGQWFGSHMTARFDKVLIDAPCTGQGTSRKDSTALKYCSTDSIGKNAKLQRELLEAAIHATKIGGRIVYSTCTLTPEENEDVVVSVLKKLKGRVEVVDPRGIGVGGREWDMEKAIQDSYAVQQTLSPTPKPQLPMLRIWPQTYDSEGFFCAVLEKTGPTKDIEKHEALRGKEEWVPKARKAELQDSLYEHFGAQLLTDEDCLVSREDRLWVTSKETMALPIPATHYAMGLPFGKKLKNAEAVLDHDLITLRGPLATKNIVEVSDEVLAELLQGKDSTCDENLHGHVLLLYKGICIGRGKAIQGKLKNHLPRWIIQLQSK